MAEIKTASGQAPTDDDDLDELIENANRFLESVYRDINMSSASRSAEPSRRRRLATPVQNENWRDAEIERINRFCDTIDLDTIRTPEAAPSTTRRRSTISRDSAILVEETSTTASDLNRKHRILQPNTNENDIIDLVNISSQDLGSTSTATISGVVVNGNNDEDDDVIIVSSELDPIVDLCMPVRQNTHRSRSPLHQRPCTVHTSTTHIQRPQQQRQLHLPNPTVTNSEVNGDVTASHSNERVVLMCPVCMESSVRRRPTSTKCGHIFCESCINHAIRLTHKCPMCNMKLTNKMIFRIYL